jgi:hypothetical protein
VLGWRWVGALRMGGEGRGERVERRSEIGSEKNKKRYKRGDGVPRWL